MLVITFEDIELHPLLRVLNRALNTMEPVQQPSFAMDLIKVVEGAIAKIDPSFIVTPDRTQRPVSEDRSRLPRSMLTAQVHKRTPDIPSGVLHSRFNRTV